MFRKEFPTRDAEAFSDFVQGRAFFQSYLGTGQGEELARAKERFAAATVRDPEFDIAKLYLAVTQTELRDSDAAIPTLESLVSKKRYLPEAYVQLAYAHVKRYRDGDYGLAEQELNKAIEASKKEKRTGLVDLIGAYRVFLLAVRGGRGKESPEKKKEYLKEALKLGNELLQKASVKERNSEEKTAVQFEVNNAMGIAFMWLGELFPTDPEAAHSWEKAGQSFKAALALRPKSVRPLQNLGLLSMFRGDRSQGDAAKAREFYSQAKEFVSESLKLNPFDQYPHFQQALFAIKTADWSAAAK